MILIKRYNDGQDGVGEWNFELEQVGILAQTPTGLRLALEWLARLSEVLKADAILNSESLEIDRWACIGPESKSIVAETMRFSLHQIHTLIAEPNPPALKKDEGSAFWFPLAGRLVGRTRIELPQESLELENAVFVRLTFSGIYAMTLVTDCDAWLSHDLLGHPQAETQAMNLPRLESTLANIAALLDVEAYVQNTPHAQVLEESIASSWEEEGDANVLEDPDRWISKQWLS